MKISIAMATFNGSRFIQEQLDSLSSQTRLPDELVICDDGSTDDTLKIVGEFQKNAGFKVVVVENESRLGYADNFLKSAKLCNGEWIAFCDQDDVWLPEKLELAEKKIKENPKCKLVLQNALITDAQLNCDGRLFPNTVNAGSYDSFSQHGFWVWVGFLQTVHSSIFEDFDCESRPLNSSPQGSVMAHDKWVCMIANVIGGIEVLSEPVAMYRRHENAVTGRYDETPLAKLAASSLLIGGDYYSYASEVASQIAEYFDYSVNASSSMSSLASKMYGKLALFYRHRSEVYLGSNKFARLKSFLYLLLHGAYLGRKFDAFGCRSLLKDVYVALFHRENDG